MDIINIKYIVNALIFAFLGLGILLVSFFVFDKLTPGHLWKEIVENKNVALAIIFGAFILGISFIIGMAIHG